MTEPGGHALELRPAAESDFETVFAITMATMRAYVEATWGIWDEAEHRSRIRDSFEPSTHRLVHVDGQLAGLLAATEHPDHIQLVKVFLLPPFQGRGIGTRLVRQVMAQAEAVRVVRDETRWVELASYSTRLGRTTPLGGLMGRVTFGGDLSPFAAWLVWGQFTHVGKDAVKGNGWYQLSMANNQLSMVDDQ